MIQEFPGARTHTTDSKRSTVTVRWNASSPFSVQDWNRWKAAVARHKIPAGNQRLLVSAPVIYNHDEAKGLKDNIRLQMKGSLGGVYVVALPSGAGAKEQLFGFCLFYSSDALDFGTPMRYNLN